MKAGPKSPPKGAAPEAAKSHAPAHSRMASSPGPSGFQPAPGNQAIQRLLKTARMSAPQDPRESRAEGMADASDGGRPLNASARGLMERSFGEDFGSVRVHSGPKAVKATQSLKANAFTVGEDIVFGEGRLQPESGEGRRLLAHELAHVVQQRRSTGGRANVEQTERDARQASVQASRGGPVEVRERAEPGAPQMDASGDLVKANVESLERLGPGGADSATGRLTQTPAGPLDPSAFPDTTTFHLEMSGAAERGGVDSKTDIVLDLRDVILAPERRSPKPDPKEETNLGPVAHLRYLREIELTDASGRQCRVVVKGYLALSYESLLEQTKGKSRPLDFDALIHLKGAQSEFSIALLEKGNIPVAASTQDKRPGEMDLSALASAAATALTIEQSGASASADFARPETTVGEQFDSIEKFLRVGEEIVIAERQKEHPKTEHHQGSGVIDVGSGKKKADSDESGWGSLVFKLFITAVVAIVLFVLLPELIVAATGVSLATAMAYVAVSLLAASFANNLIARWKEGRAAGSNFLSILSTALMDTLEISKVQEAITDRSALTGEKLNRSLGERIAGGVEGAVGTVLNALGVHEWAGSRVPRVKQPDIPTPEPPDAPVGTTADPWAPASPQIPAAEPDAPNALQDWSPDIRAKIKEQGIPDIAERRAAVAKAAEDAKAAEAAKQVEIQAAAQNAQPMAATAGGSPTGGGPARVGSVRGASGGGRGGGATIRVVPPPRSLEPVFQPGAPRNAAAVRKVLEDAGLTPHQIVAFGAEDASRLGTKSADLVVTLGEHFTADDLKSLGEFLAATGAVLDKETAEQLIKIVPRGEMNKSIPAIDVSELRAPQTTQLAEVGDDTGVNVIQPRQPASGGGLVPLWRIAEERLGPILEERFGPGWQRSPRQAAPSAAEGETLGSTVPEYYNEQLRQSFEVKRLHLDELGIGPNGELQSGPSEASREAIRRARRQVAGRRWIHPEGTEQNIVFNVTGQGVKNVQEVGRQLRTVLENNNIHYDRVYVQDGQVLTEIQ